MGNIYAKTYFPYGYIGWINSTEIDENPDVAMDEKTYETFVIDPESREIIKRISETYQKEVSDLETSIEDFLLDQCKQKPEIAVNRLVYDSLIANRLCHFWLTLIDQPRESIKTFFKENKPKVEDIFYEMEKKYNLQDCYPAYETIHAYQTYC